MTLLIDEVKLQMKNLKKLQKEFFYNKQMILDLKRHPTEDVDLMIAIYEMRATVALKQWEVLSMEIDTIISVFEP